jgi:hypothetical protein
MYRLELSDTAAKELLESLDGMDFHYNIAHKTARRSAKKLSDESRKLFRGFTEQSAVNLNADTLRHLRNIRDISERIVLILHGERFRTKSVELLAWIQDNYNADISKIDLNAISAAIYDAPHIEAQKKIMRKQADRLYQAICGLREVKHGAEVEKQHHQKRSYSHDPVEQTLRNESSERFGVVWHLTRKLLTAEYIIDDRTEMISRLIKKYESIRDQAAAFVSHGDLVCWLETDADRTHLCAMPKSMSKQLHNDLWRKGVPTVLVSGG